MIDHYIVNIKVILYIQRAEDTRKDSIFNENNEFVEILQYDITDWRQLDLTEVVWAHTLFSRKYG